MENDSHTHENCDWRNPDNWKITTFTSFRVVGEVNEQSIYIYKHVERKYFFWKDLVNFFFRSKYESFETISEDYSVYVIQNDSSAYYGGGLPLLLKSTDESVAELFEDLVARGEAIILSDREVRINKVCGNETHN